MSGELSGARSDGVLRNTEYERELVASAQGVKQAGVAVVAAQRFVRALSSALRELSRITPDGGDPVETLASFAQSQVTATDAVSPIAPSVLPSSPPPRLAEVSSDPDSPCAADALAVPLPDALTDGVA